MARTRKIVCPKCRAKLKLDLDKISTAQIKFRCPGCASILRLRKPEQAPESSSPDALRQKTLDLNKRLDLELGFTADDKVHAGGKEKAEELHESDRNMVGSREKLSGSTTTPGLENGPLIPEEKLTAAPRTGESLLEEIPFSKLKEFEEGEPGENDFEWTRFADKRDGQLQETKINMNELSAPFAFLKETLTNQLQAEKLNLQGETSFSKKLFQQAITAFSQALEINPDYVAALVNRGSTLAQLSRFNEALKDFNHALQFEKYDAAIYNRRGEIYLQNKMHDQAIRDFTAAIILDPMNTLAYLSRGRAYSEKNMPEEARSDFKQALRTETSIYSFNLPNRPPADIENDAASSHQKTRAEELIQQGVAALESENFDEALKKLSHAISLAAVRGDGYGNRGRVYLKLLQPDKALADLNQAVQLAPLNPAHYFWRAQVWEAKGEGDKLIDDLKISCELGYEPACLAYSRSRAAKKSPPRAPGS